MIKKLRITILIFVPLIFLIIGLRFDRTKFSTDPESAYLLNGLNIAMGRTVGHYDNPGTTVQMYCAAVVSVTHLLRFSEHNLQTDVLLHSELYIEILRKSLIVLNSLLLLLLGIFAFTLLHNFWAGLLLQVTPFLSITLIEELSTKVAPEPLLFAAIAVFIMLLLSFYKSDNPEKRKYPLLFGLLAGFGLATKMTFLPVLIIPFIILNGKRHKWIYVAAIIPSFVLFTLPALTGYMHMANWFLNLGTHTGQYGQGTSGIIDFDVYLSSLKLIATNNKALVAVMILAALALLFYIVFARKQEQKKYSKEFYILLALLISQSGSILMVAKHYHSNHYLFPALSLTGLLLVFIYLLINKHLSENKRTVFKFSLPLAVIIVTGFSLLNIPAITLAFDGYRISNKSTDDTFSRIEREYPGFVSVYYYPSSFNEYSSLRWGNVYSRQYSTEKLMELFPEGLFYNAWEKSFQIWETNISPREFVKKYGGRILLVGGPLRYEDLKKVEQDGLKLTKLFDSKGQVVFQVDTAQSTLFRQNVHSGQPVWSLQNDFEIISSDKEWIMSGDGTRFSKNSSLAGDRVRSGKQAFKLPVKDTYAMSFELENVKAGDMFEVSIWRSSVSQDAFLVASAGSADPFYQQNNRSVEKDSKGWQKVTLDFKIPDGFKGNKLTIFLWNNGNDAAWFDDFEINKY